MIEKEEGGEGSLYDSYPRGTTVTIHVAVIIKNNYKLGVN